MDLDFSNRLSLRGCRWEIPTGDSRQITTLIQRLGVPEIIARLLVARGVTEAEAAEAFLKPSLRETLPDPSRLQDLERAAKRLADAVEQTEPLGLLGDYDVDGATSTALVVNYFKALGWRHGETLVTHIPDRHSEGYGPSVTAMEGFKAKGLSLVLTLDCGTTAFGPLAAAAELGLQVIVCDHHSAESQLPPAYAVVNPNRIDESGELSSLCAVGVTFLLLVGLNRELRNRGWFAASGRAEPNLLHWLDLVALGTVCDVVPLTGLNRVLVAQGLKVMARRENIGLRALADHRPVNLVTGSSGRALVSQTLAAWHLGFVLGPRINAGGRVGNSSLGLRLLTCDAQAEAEEIALQLDGLNQQRQEYEQECLLEAEGEILAQVEAQSQAKQRLGMLFAAGRGWHPGIVGIAAARIKERFNRPALVIALDDLGKGSGSARSLAGFDIGAAVMAARHLGLVKSGGGHAMAAGLTIEESQIPALQQFLDQRFLSQFTEGELVPVYTAFGALAVSGVTAEFIARLEAMAPFGTANPEPRFVLTRVSVSKAFRMGVEKTHLGFTIGSEDGGTLKGVAFRLANTALGSALLQPEGRRFHLLGTLGRDDYRGGENLQFKVEDAMEA
ncbi:MAG: single-stranded-DNA-specific exonuclease RecJ [Alphaproteobacteria bacterium]|nr:single-stranded-DNA-specific exonuclease RecJ [Alphaproteobacteria bacterium]